MTKSRALIILTSHAALGLTGKKTGFFLAHVTHPLFELERAGWLVDIASLAGGAAPLDENSRDLSDPINRDYMERKTFQHRIANTLSLSSLDKNNYAAVILAGGYGALWDFPESNDLSTTVSTIYENGGVVGAIGEGTAGVLSLASNKKVTGPSVAEMMATGLADRLPMFCETKLKKADGIYSSKNIWQKFAVVDDRLITGQNSRSAQAVGEAVVRRLQVSLSETSQLENKRLQIN